MSLLRATAVFSSTTMISRITGFVRDILIARLLGTSVWADMFFIALKVPNLFRSLFAEGALNASFVPMYNEKMTVSERNALSFGIRIFSLLFYTLILFVVAVEIVMPYLVLVFLPGFDQTPEKLKIGTELCRITFPFLFFIALVSLQSAVLNAYEKFAAAAFTSTIQNLMMIGALCIAGFLTFNAPVLLSWVFMGAGAVEFVWLSWHLRRHGIYLRLLPVSVIWKPSKDVRLFLRRFFPSVFSSGLYQISLIMDMFFVSFLPTGAISWLYYATRLFQLPIGLIGVALGVVLLPFLSKQIASGDTKGATQSMNRALELGLLFSVPSATGLVLLSAPIIAVLFQHGSFDVRDIAPTASALTVFALGLPAYTMTKALMAGFYARGDTQTPAKISLVGLVCNFLFILLFLGTLRHIGIALAASLAAWINTFQYAYLLHRKKHFTVSKPLVKQALKILSACLVMGAVLFSLLSAFGEGWYLSRSGILFIPTRFLVLSALVLTGGFTYFISLIFLGTIPLKTIKNLVRRK